MATYSSRLRLTLPATGEYTNTWGAVVNDGITSLVDDSISGTSAITIAGTDYTLTSVNGSTDEARRMFIVATGTPGAARNVICPAVTKLYSITNSTTGGFALTLKTSAGSGISVPNGATMLLKCDGTNVVQAASAFTDVTYTGTLTGGTGIVNLGSGQFYKDASGNLLVGNTSQLFPFANRRTVEVNGTSQSLFGLTVGGSSAGYWLHDGTDVNLYNTRSGAMTFGTNNAERMRLDASGNLGLGVTPSAWSGLKAIQVNAKTSINSGGTTGALTYNSFYDGSFKYITTDFALDYRQNSGNGSHAWFTAPSGTAGNAISFTQAMTLDASGNLGIGTTSPGYKLTVAGTSPTIVAADAGANTTRAYVSATNAQVSYGATYGGSAVPIVFGVGLAAGVPASEWMRLDASGNLLVGTTSIPAYASKVRLQGGLEIHGSQQHNVAPGNTNPYEIVNRSSGGFDFYPTPTILATRIDSSGNLLVGTTTANAKFYVSGVASTGLTARFDSTNNNTIPVFQLITFDTTGDSLWQQFYSNGTALRGSITFNRAGGLTVYNTTSDYRAKDIFGPVQNPGAAIDALKVYEGQMKGATQSRPMLVAHEAQAVAPYAVTGTKDAVDAEGQPVYQQIDVSSLVPLLLAEIQSLRARVAALEAA